jgi:DNA-binding NtrC family response regulator
MTRADQNRTRTVLVVEDDPTFRGTVAAMLRLDGFHVVEADDVAGAVQQLRQEAVTLIVLDLGLPRLNGLELLRSLVQRGDKTPVIVLTGQAGEQNTLDAMRLGAFDFVVKGNDSLAEILRIIRRAADRREQHGGAGAEVVRFDAKDEEALRGPIVGHSGEIVEVFKGIARVGPHDSTTLILGETGTGKELVARAIHQNSRRRAKPFLPVNCTAIPENLLESELFGHEKGAFTGADRKRIGIFEQCMGGTIFLDEIGDMPPATQAKVLRVLQEKCFQRVGGTEAIHVDLRVLAATNRDLLQAVRDKVFREDLYYRLAVYTINVPPLRERLGDVPLLAEAFLRKFRTEFNKPGLGLTVEAAKRLQAHKWPGNVRELHNLIEKLSLSSQDGGDITAEDVSAALDQPPPCFPTLAPTGEPTEVGQANPSQFSLAAVESAHIRRVLEYTGWNQSQAAALLAINRRTVSEKIKKYNIQQPR